MENIKKLLVDLSNLDSLPGSEEKVVNFLKNELSETSLKVERDNLGSIAFIKEGKQSHPKIMLAAHMDSPGFMIKKIEKNGDLRISPVGGWWTHVLLSQRVKVENVNGKLFTGIIGAKPPHILKVEERKKVVDFDDIFVDIGARNSEEVRKKFKINIGSPAYVESKSEVLNKTDLIVGKGFDNKASLAAGVALMKELEKYDLNSTVMFVGTTQEEVGLRGAKTASQKWNPDIGIGMDVTISYDSSGLPEKDVKLGKGASLTIMDRGAIADKKFIEYVRNLADSKKIKYEQDIFLIGGTDTAELQRAHNGAISMAISVPLRYMHTHNEVIDSNDVLEVKELLKAICLDMDERKFEKLRNK